MKRSLLTLSLAFICNILIAQTVPGTLSYQGILMQNDGITPVTDGSHSIVFNFYNVSSGGSALFSRTATVTTSRGIFSVIVGGGSAPNAPFLSGESAQLSSQQTYVGITVDGGSELTPRAQLTTTAYAYQAQSAYAISDNIVSTSKIVDAAVTTAKLSDASVTTAKLVDGSVTNAKLASGIDAAKITTGILPATVFPTGTIGRVPFWSAANTVGSDASLFWDNTNKRLGIGTATPSYPLHVTTTASRAGYFQNTAASGTAYGIRAEATGTNTGTNYGIYAVASNGQKNTAGYFSGDVDLNGDLFHNAWTLSTRSTSTTFVTTHWYDFTPYSTGTVSIYYSISALNGSTSTGLVPAVDNDAYLGGSSARWIRVYAVDGTISTSDVRLKKDINNLGYGLAEILDLRPVTYKWKKDNGKTYLGFIAQEVEKVTPEVVDIPTNENEHYGLNYSALVPVLVKGMQEQQAQIEQLKSANVELQKRLAAIEALVTKSTSSTTTASLNSEK